MKLGWIKVFVTQKCQLINLVRNGRSRYEPGACSYVYSISFNVRHNLHDKALKFLCVDIIKPKVKPFLILRVCLSNLT